MKYDKRALKRLMRERGWDQMETAQRANLARTTILHLAHGHTVPRADTLAQLAKAFDVPLSAFYTDDAA